MGIVPQARPLGGPVGAQWRLLEAWESFLFPRAIIVATHCVPVAALGFHFAALGSIFATFCPRWRLLLCSFKHSATVTI